MAGPTFGTSGDLTNRTSGSINGQDVSLQARSFESLFGVAWLYGFRVGKQMGEHDVYLRFGYTHAGGDGGSIGTSEGSRVTATIDDYSDFALLAGVRREFLQPSRLHPYAGFEAGVRFVDDLSVRLASDSFGRTGDLPFYDSTTVFTAEITFGVSYDLTNAFRIGLETGLRYQGSLDADDSALARFGLGGFNTSEDLYFIPLLLTGSWSF